MEKLTTVLGLMTRYEEAIELSGRTMAMYRALGEVEGEGRAAWLIGLMYHEMNRPGPALTRLEPIVEDLRTRGLSVASQARLYAGMTHLLLFRGQSGGEGEVALTDLHRAAALAEQAIDLARTAKSDAQLAWALFSRGFARACLGHFDDALRDYEATVPLVDEAAGDLWIASNALANAGASIAGGASSA